MKTVIFGYALAVAAIAFSSSASATTLNLCTAKVGGNYEYAGKLFKEQFSGVIDINVINTKGSVENLEKINSGECDAAIVQSDAQYVFEKDNGKSEADLLAPLYTEYYHLLCRREANITGLDSLSGRKVMIGEVGTGSQVTFRGTVLADKEFGSDEYSKIVPINRGGDKGSLVDIRSGKADCLVYVGTPNSTFMTNYAQKFGESLVLVPVEDKDFDDVELKTADGETYSVWNKSVLPYSAYESIMPSGVFGRKDVNTISVNAQFVVSNKWRDANSDAYGELGFYIPDVAKRLQADKGLVLE